MGRSNVSFWSPLTEHTALCLLLGFSKLPPPPVASGWVPCASSVTLFLSLPMGQNPSSVNFHLVFPYSDTTLWTQDRIILKDLKCPFQRPLPISPNRCFSEAVLLVTKHIRLVAHGLSLESFPLTPSWYKSYLASSDPLKSLLSQGTLIDPRDG